MEAFSTLVSNVQVTLGQVRGVTCLPLPPDPRVYADKSNAQEASAYAARLSYLAGWGHGNVLRGYYKPAMYLCITLAFCNDTGKSI